MIPSDRQSLLFIHDEISMEEFAAADTPNVIEYGVPPGARQAGGAGIEITEVFDGTTPTISVGTETDPDGYVAATVATALGYTAGAGAELDNPVPAGEKILVTFIPGAGATTGKVRVSVGYLVAGRSTETQD